MFTFKEVEVLQGNIVKLSFIPYLPKKKKNHSMSWYFFAAINHSSIAFPINIFFLNKLHFSGIWFYMRCFHFQEFYSFHQFFHPSITIQTLASPLRQLSSDFLWQHYWWRWLAGSTYPCLRHKMNSAYISQHDPQVS